MKKNDIIESLKKHIKNYPNRVFYKQCIEEINNIDNIKNDDILSNLKMNKYILESVRITILYNTNKYKLYLANKEYVGCTNYLLDIEINIKSKLIYQLSCITKYNNILSLENDQNVPEMDFNKKMYIIITEQNIDNLYELKNLYEITGYIFGIEIFKVLEYQQLDRIIGFITQFNNGELNGYSIMDNYLMHTRKYDWQFRDNLLIINNMVFNTIGLTHKSNIELIGLLGLDYKNAMSFASEFIDYIDPIITTNNEQLYHKYGKSIKYNYRWLIQVLPSLINVDNIIDMIYDPTHTFIFMGIKFMSLDFIINKLLAELNSTNCTDLMMMGIVNGYNIGKKLCIPNMIVKHGKIKIFNNNVITKLYNKINKKCKNYYNYDITYEKITNTIKKCNIDAFDIYQGKNVYDPDTGIIRKFHRDVKAKIFFEYGKGKKILLDIGIGQFTDLMTYDKLGLSVLVGIEPSIISIENGYKRIEKYGTGKNMNIKIVNGVGDEIWKNFNKYNIVLSNKYDIISFQFTIHYMIHNIEIVMNNIMNVCKLGTIIIITCMDGNRIFEEIRKKGFIEVRNEIEPLFAIYPEYNYKDTDDIESNVMVYFKGSYGVVSGSQEPLVNITKLKQIFNKYGFNLLKHKDFLDYTSRVKDNMNNIQKKVSYYYTSLVFIKNKN